MMFEYELARNMQMLRADLLDTITNEEYTEWLAMEQIAPMQNTWKTNAILCALMANIFSGKGRKAKAEDFMPIRKKKSFSESNLKSYMSKFVKTNTK